MYNRYMNSGGFEDFFSPSAAANPQPAPQTEIPEAPTPDPESKLRGLNAALKNLTGGGIRLPELDADTLLLLVLVYFLVADNGENVSDTLLIIGALLLLGF